MAAVSSSAAALTARVAARPAARQGRSLSAPIVCRVCRSRVYSAQPQEAPYSMKDYAQTGGKGRITFRGVHHVALLCESLERSLDFYCGVLGLEINPDRPHEKLPYRGAWLWIGPEMIHLMELPNPDPLDGRPEHGGRDRHTCVGVEKLEAVEARLKEAGITYTRSKSGRPALFFRDPDSNCLEVVEIEAWR